jgi:carbon storage regulator CsrA
MLVLTRRPGEQIVIGNGIRVTVVSVGPGRVKIGIEAPADVRIDRQEIHDRIQHEHAADVLAAVGRAVAGDDVSPTVVASSGDTSTSLHNRIADQLSESGVSDPGVAKSHTPAPSPTSRDPRPAAPRKPR